MIRTGYSFRTAIGHLPEVISRIKEIGWKVAPIADRTSTFGFVRWTKLTKAAGLRPVYGVELAVTAGLGEKRPIIDWWTFVARDSLQALHELIHLATSQGACLTYEQALAFEGFKISGPAVNLEKVKPGMDFYVGLSPASPVGLIRRAWKEGHVLCAIPNNFYPREGDEELYRVQLGGRSSSTQTYPMWIQSDDEFRASLAGLDPYWLDQALMTQECLLAASLAVLPKANLLVPEKTQTLEGLCREGAARLGVNLDDPIYSARLQKELALIEEKAFEDYFYIIADLMQFARSRMVVGPARGSSCGSLVCYLLGITAIDPIPYGLIFERFIDTTRSDLPDIDLDFSDVRRHEVFEYLEGKYGRERVARLGSVNTLGAKSALNQIGISLKIPSHRIDEVSATVVKRSMGDSRAGSTIEDTLDGTDTGRAFMTEFPEARIVTRIEGHPSNAAQHAAGVVITQDPVTNFVAIDARIGGTMCDKKDAEELNLLKIDALGLTQLSIFERTMEIIGEKPRSEFLEAIPLDDPLAFQVLNDLKFAGIFQFEVGTACSRLVEDLRSQGAVIDNIEDLISLTALVRPGPLGSGQTEEWIRRRAGRAAVSYPHPAMEGFLKSTLGIVAYQEQVMHIGREIGGLSWDDVTALRKAMSKSLGKEYFDQFGDRWKHGAINKIGLEPKLADKIWDDLCAYGMWAFNRSHSVAYGVVSYWCCWLKAHHPLAFAAATLDAQGDVDKQLAFLRELAAEGIEYVAVDPEKSGDKWVVADGKLIGPVTNIKGIGPSKLVEIMEARRGGKKLSPSLAKKLMAAKTPIDSLTPIENAILGLPLTEMNVSPYHVKIADCNPDQAKGDQHVKIMAKIMRIAPLNENEPSRVAKRGGRVFSGPTNAVNLFFRDDTGEIFCKVGRYDYDRIGKIFVEKAKKGKSLFAIKGIIPSDFRMIRVTDVKYLGELE